MRRSERWASVILVAAFWLIVGLSTAMAQGDGALTPSQDEELIENRELRKAFFDLGVKYPSASEVLVFKAAEELVDLDLIMSDTQAALDETIKPLSLGDMMRDVALAVAQAGGHVTVNVGGLAVDENQSDRPLPGVEMLPNHVMLENLGATLSSTIYPFTPGKSTESDGEGFIFYTINQIGLAVNGDAETKAGFLQIVLPWPPK